MHRPGVTYDIMDGMVPRRASGMKNPETFDPSGNYDAVFCIRIYDAFDDVDDAFRPSVDAVTERIRYATEGDIKVADVSPFHISALATPFTRSVGWHSCDVHENTVLDRAIVLAEFGIRFSNRLSSPEALRFLIRLDHATRLHDFPTSDEGLGEINGFCGISISYRGQQIIFSYLDYPVFEMKVAADYLTEIDKDPPYFLSEKVKDEKFKDIKRFCSMACRREITNDELRESLKEVRKFLK